MKIARRRNRDVEIDLIHPHHSQKPQKDREVGGSGVGRGQLVAGRVQMPQNREGGHVYYIVWTSVWSQDRRAESPQKPKMAGWHVC